MIPPAEVVEYDDRWPLWFAELRAELDPLLGDVPHVPHRDHVVLRDLLRADAGARERYAARKRELAPLLAGDRAAYGEGKAALIGELVGQALGR